ncbi:MAG: endonuclease/exonuclease/phosphatase family protein [Pseudomonadota bacterium]
MTETTGALPPVTVGQRARILAAPRTAAAHAALLAEIPAMAMLEVGGDPGAPRLSAGFAAAAWNVERCLFPEASAAHLGPFAPEVILLSEMDVGMSRTGQRNTVAAMAAELGMTYAYGVEFHELGLGGATERGFCTDDFNRFGWHGNAVLSAAPFEDLALMRLDRNGRWFAVGPDAAGDPDQPRIGGRMAVAAITPTANGPICVVSTHLESNADAAHRHVQFAALLDMIDDFAPGAPVVIGGDLNTGNHAPPDFDWRAETLFDLARGRGYSWDLTPPGVTTRESLISPHPKRQMKLDWFCVRGVGGRAGPLLASLDPAGTPLSDHECVICEVTV